mgnify:CR=1 FL=1
MDIDLQIKNNKKEEWLLQKDLRIPMLNIKHLTLSEIANFIGKHYFKCYLKEFSEKQEIRYLRKMGKN